MRTSQLQVQKTSSITPVIYQPNPPTHTTHNSTPRTRFKILVTHLTTPSTVIHFAPEVPAPSPAQPSQSHDAASNEILRVTRAATRHRIGTFGRRAHSHCWLHWVVPTYSKSHMHAGMRVCVRRCGTCIYTRYLWLLCRHQSLT